MLRTALLALLLAGPAPDLAARAEEAAYLRRTFVEDNLLATLYREIGLALIDLMRLPVPGQQDSADQFSTFLIDDLWEEDSAAEIAVNVALALSLAADRDGADGAQTAGQDARGAGRQRYFDHVCLFYGADPALRAGFAADMGLPEGRAESCADAYALAALSWGGVLDDLADAQAGRGLRLVAANADPDFVALIQDEVADLNSRYPLPVWVNLRLEPCGVADAFYSPDDRTIRLCTEYVQGLFDLYDAR